MLETILLLRLIPYIMAGMLAWQKGYTRLTIAIGFFVTAIGSVLLFKLPPETRSIFGSFGSFFLLWHAVDLRGRKNGSH